MIITSILRYSLYPPLLTLLLQTGWAGNTIATRSTAFEAVLQTFSVGCTSNTAQPPARCYPAEVIVIKKYTNVIVRSKIEIVSCW